VTIRPERAADASAVRAVNESAFETDVEARLVDVLRVEASPLVSLVAEIDGSICGHILFSPITLQQEVAGSQGASHSRSQPLGLAPMAVSPSHQRKGIGSALVRAGLAACRQLECEAVVVLGHPQFYPRFGFRPASHFGLRSEYDVPDEVFMAMELTPGSLAGKHGIVRYHPAFARVL
jgi:putative acetyltransferase